MSETGSQQGLVPVAPQGQMEMVASTSGPQGPGQAPAPTYEQLLRFYAEQTRQTVQVDPRVLWSVPGLLSRRVHNSQHRWPCDAVRAARTLMTGRVAATVVVYVDGRALQRARRRRIVRREQEAQIHHTNRLTM